MAAVWWRAESEARDWPEVVPSDDIKNRHPVVDDFSWVKPLWTDDDMKAAVEFAAAERAKQSTLPDIMSALREVARKHS